MRVETYRAVLLQINSSPNLTLEAANMKPDISHYKTFNSAD